MFSPNVYHLIFTSLFDEDDTESLASYSLACSGFRDKCQSLLYRRVRLTSKFCADRRASLRRRALDLLRTLSANSRLADAMRELDVEPFPLLDQSGKPGDVLFLSNRLANSSGVVTLRIQLPRAEQPPFRWTSIPESLHGALEKIMFSPRLRTLVLVNGRHSLKYLLSHLKEVKSLAFERLYFSPGDCEPPFDCRAQPLEVEDLKIPVRQLERYLMQVPGQATTLPIAWDSIRSLTFELDDPQKRQIPPYGIAPILRETSNLSKINLWCMGDLGDLANIFDTLNSDAYETLQTIEATFSTESGRSSDAEKSPYIGLLDALARFPEENKVQSVCFRIDVQLHSPWNVYQKPWTKIADVLTPTRFPCLKALELDVCVYGGEGYGDEALDINEAFIGPEIDHFGDWLNFAYDVQSGD